MWDRGINGRDAPDEVSQCEGSKVSQLKTTPVDSAANADLIINTFVDVIHSYNVESAGIAFGFPGPCDYEKGICYIYTNDST